MKEFKVTIFLMYPHQGSLENPKLKKAVFFVYAENQKDAYKKAELLNNSLWSTFDYKVEFK
jgi:hypothetical protein